MLVEAHTSLLTKMCFFDFSEINISLASSSSIEIESIMQHEF